MNIQCAMGVNGAIVLANKYDLPFKYYCIIDQNFVRDRIALVREIVSRDLTLYISPEVLRYIVQGVPQEEIRCRICIIELILERAYQRSTAPATLVRMVQANPDLHLLDAELGLGFSFNAALGVFDADTVAYAALQVLFSYGARNLYVHGLDLSLENGLRFYDEGVSPQSSRLARHFARVIEPSFRFAARHWAERGLSVYNLSPVSALPPDVIERATGASCSSPVPSSATKPPEPRHSGAGRRREPGRISPHSQQTRLQGGSVHSWWPPRRLAGSSGSRRRFRRAAAARLADLGRANQTRPVNSRKITAEP